jgi:hypothetical protein
MRRMEGAGKEIRESWGFGGGEVKVGEDIFEGVLKDRTGMMERARV